LDADPPPQGNLRELLADLDPASSISSVRPGELSHLLTAAHARPDAADKQADNAIARADKALGQLADAGAKTDRLERVSGRPGRRGGAYRCSNCPGGSCRGSGSASSSGPARCSTCRRPIATRGKAGGHVPCGPTNSTSAVVEICAIAFRMASNGARSSAYVRSAVWRRSGVFNGLGAPERGWYDARAHLADPPR
jgi:hypothetical protein